MVAAAPPNACPKLNAGCDEPNEKPEAEMAPGAALAAEAADVAVPGFGVSHDLHIVAEASFINMHVSHSHCPAAATPKAENVLGAAGEEEDEAGLGRMVLATAAEEDEAADEDDEVDEDEKEAKEGAEKLHGAAD